MRWGRISLLTAAIAWIGLSAIAERVMLHPRRWDVGPPPSARGWAYDPAAFRTADGLTLRGWWIPGSRHETVVMVHGWTSSRREPYDKSAYLHNAGYNLLVFDLRGSGHSDGDSTTLAYREPLDVQAAVAYAKQMDPGPLALFGYSMGGATAVEEAARNPQVDAVIEDSGYASLSTVVTGDFQRATGLPLEPAAAVFLAIGQQDLGVPMSAIHPVTDAASLRKPLLVVVGTADKVVAPDQGYRLYAAAAGPKQLLVVPGAGHTSAYYKDRPTYTRTVLDFLQRSLG